MSRQKDDTESSKSTEIKEEEIKKAEELLEQVIRGTRIEDDLFGDEGVDITLTPVCAESANQPESE